MKDRNRSAVAWAVATKEKMALAVGVKRATGSVLPAAESRPWCR